MRSGTGFEIILRESRADRDQLYLIIKLAGTVIPAPGTLFVIGDGEGCRKVPLPNGQAPGGAALCAAPLVLRVPSGRRLRFTCPLRPWLSAWRWCMDPPSGSSQGPVFRWFSGPTGPDRESGGMKSRVHPMHLITGKKIPADKLISSRISLNKVTVENLFDKSYDYKLLLRP